MSISNNYQRLSLPLMLYSTAPLFWHLISSPSSRHLLRTSTLTFLTLQYLYSHQERRYQK